LPHYKYKHAKKRLRKIATGNTAQVWLILSWSLPHSHLLMTTWPTSLKKSSLYTDQPCQRTK